jgi:hypothetical protein
MNPVQGTAQAVSASGTITAFGSVFVNGIRYDVSAARMQKNGHAVAQSGLAVGEVALVRGHQDLTSGQGMADSVEVEDNVIGPIGKITGDQFTALGQSVKVTANTSFAKDIVPGDLTGLRANDLVEVSGFAGPDGLIMATRIARAGAEEPLQVLGTVAGLDSTTSHTFMINELKVDFSTAAVTGFAAGTIADGDLVVVRGTQFDATAVALTAATVELAGTDPRAAADGDHAETGHVELEGMIMNFVSDTDFEVAGAKVTTTAGTVFEGGSAKDLGDNLRVEVRGSLDDKQVLVADMIEIEHVAAIALESTVSKPDVINNTLELLGVTVTVDSSTRFEDKSSAQLQLFTLKDLVAGDTVMVRGFESPAGSGKVAARKLERLPPSTEAVVRGPFVATTAPQFSILDITIDATSASFGHAEEDASMSPGDFFAQAVGQIVEARGTASGNTVNATEVRIDSEEDR